MPNFPTSIDTAASFPAPAHHGEHVPPGLEPGSFEKTLRDQVLALQTAVGADGGARRKQVVRSEIFNIDNGAGTTIDDVVLNLGFPVTVTAARIVYVHATTGTVAAGNAKIGTTLGGAEVVAATAYQDNKAVGTTTPMTVITAGNANKIPAGTSLYVRHTGIAVTVAGEAYVEVEYTID